MFKYCNSILFIVELLVLELLFFIWLFYRFFFRIFEVRILEGFVLEIVFVLRYEINRGFVFFREIVLGRDLKKFLVVC